MNHIYTLRGGCFGMSLGTTLMLRPGGVQPPTGAPTTCVYYLGFRTCRRTREPVRVVAP